MGFVKTFSEFIKESFSSVGKLANSIYAVLDKEYSGNFYEPDSNADSACLDAELDSFNLEYNGDLFEISFDEDCLFNTDDIVFYQIFVADNAPIDPNNDVTSSLWIEFGENGYTEGPETWCLYYDTENDSWESTGADDEIRDSRIIEVVTRITSLVNPHTKYVPGYEPSEEGYSD